MNTSTSCLLTLKYLSLPSHKEIATLSVVRSLITLNISSFQKAPPKLTGRLKINNRLQKVQKLFENKIIGPESIAVDSTGAVYTGSADGKIWRISGQDAEILTTTGTNASECGKTSLLLLSNSSKWKTLFWISHNAGYMQKKKN